jgi:hypothetical protein
MAIEGKSEATMRRRLRLGTVGGGPGAFIGGFHRTASRLDDRYELVAGAMASDPARARAGAAAVGIAPDRAYGNSEEMVTSEKTRPDRIDAVAIVTPNFAHHAPAKAFLEAGFRVICDKPVTTSLATALDLAETVRGTGMIFGLTYTYTGYPMVRQAREMVAAGELGKVCVVQVEYAQDWLTTPLERTGQKQAEWSTDPARSGRMPRRHRHPRLQSRRLRHRPAMSGAGRRSLDLCWCPVSPMASPACVSSRATSNPHGATPPGSGSLDHTDGDLSPPS